MKLPEPTKGFWDQAGTALILLSIGGAIALVALSLKI